MNKKKESQRSKKVDYSFLGSVVVLYLILTLVNLQQTQKALLISARLFLNILPAFVLVILFMAALNYFLNPQKVKKLLGKESGLKGWLIAMALGIVSHGSIYAWYPLLRDLREHGMREGLIAVFIYNRAIKIPFIPVLVYYFGLKFFIVLLIYMLIASVVEGILIERI